MYYNIWLFIHSHICWTNNILHWYMYKQLALIHVCWVPQLYNLEDHINIIPIKIYFLVTFILIIQNSINHVVHKLLPYFKKTNKDKNVIKLLSSLCLCKYRTRRSKAGKGFKLYAQIFFTLLETLKWSMEIHYYISIWSTL